MATYVNTSDIFNSNEPTFAKLDFASTELVQTELIETNFGDANSDDVVECHVYNFRNALLYTNYRTPGWSVEASLIGGYPNLVTLDIHNNIRDFGIESGTFKVIYNFFRNLVGSYEGSKLYIGEYEQQGEIRQGISDSRTEVRLIPQNQSISNQINALAVLNFNLDSETHHNQLVINFGNNNIVPVANIQLFGSYVICKLFEPLPQDYNLLDTCWLSLAVLDSYAESISLFRKGEVFVPPTIGEPNFDINVDDYAAIDSDFKTWNDILGSNLLTSQQIIDSYFSGSLQELRLNVGYNDFDNFIHFSSAEQRVANFKYKLQLIEYYESKLKSLSAVTGSVVNNVVDYYKKRSNVISGFDGFESWMYFESGSNFTHISGTLDPWPKVTGSSAERWQTLFSEWNASNAITDAHGGTYTVTPHIPKYTLYSTTSSVADTYYDSLVSLAQTYDRENLHALVNTVPDDIRNSGMSDNYELFVNMIGHHFDILWTYIKSLGNIWNRDEHPKEGLSLDLVYDTTKALGWELAHGNRIDDLWDYTLGFDATGSIAQTGSLYSKSRQDVTKEVWKRILNNLPHILKTKGTERSVKAMMSCYGVPATILRVREYGGPASDSYKPKYVYSKFNYATKFETGSQQYMTGSIEPWGLTPNTIEFRFKQSEPTASDTAWKELLNIDTGYAKIEFQKTGSDDDERGNLRFTAPGGGTITINDQYVFDDGFSSVMVTHDGSDFDFYLKKSEYGKLVINVSGSVTAAWSPTGSFVFGLNLTGSAQEFRLWSTALGESAFNEHVYAPASYVGNTATSSYYELLMRAEMDEKIDLAVTQSVNSTHPNQNYSESVYYVNMHSESFEALEEDQYLSGLSIGTKNIYSNKIRIESNRLIRGLDTDNSGEWSEFDRAPIDSNKVGVYFSPQDITDEDIYQHAGYISLDDYIGDPALYNADEYKTLVNFSNEYFKKYPAKNSLADYIRFIGIFDFSIFHQIRRLLPLRSNKLLGLVIEPNLLERYKFKELQISRSVHSWEAGQDVDPETQGEFKQRVVTVDYDWELQSAVESYTIENDTFNGVQSVSGESVDTNTYKTVTTGSEGESSGYQFTNLITDATGVNYFVTASNSSDAYNPLGTVVTGSRIWYYNKTEKYFYSSSLSESLDKFYSSSLEPSTVVDANDIAYGLQRSFYDGSQLTAPGINVNSVDTVDGGPVVRVTKTNPHQMIKKEKDASGSLLVV